jgi:hypothetical protein
MAFSEDLTVFFDTNDFAVNAVKSDGTKIVGIFDIEPVELDDFISNEPTFLINQTDAASVPRGTVLIIEGSTYTVRNLVRDEQKLTKLILQHGA